ncbi:MULTISPECIES: helix-turn-helix transcriptional regulator [Megasphaera]|uniref:helix-turn-helix transcriptional regulator n=1 Tax=Megasphaera TaxID=906 RepID=UPI001CD20423|nr:MULTISPECIES: helix-turn-helix domain-containing protein [Megasphaera]UBS54319.1 helix-turn-helix domain-containing protein [Megasphaera massiliensis]
MAYINLRRLSKRDRFILQHEVILLNDKKEQLEQALTVLGREFPLLNWDFRPDPSSGRTELISQWLGDAADEIMVCAFTGSHIDERFHRQDFFFVNFAYRGNYEALSASSQNRISMKEGDCYLGQPYSGYALKKDGSETIVIVGILIKKETFLREYLSVLGADTDLLHFFLEPAVNQYADGIISFTPGADSPIWSILDLMVLEYVRRTDQSQSILKALFLSMAMYMSEAVRAQNKPARKASVTEEIMAYIEYHSDTATLKSTAARFGYHPVYLSRLLSEKEGRTFSEILLSIRMKKAAILLQSTDLSIEKIAAMLGYSNNSNFYKAFKEYYGTSPKARFR